MRTSSGVWNHLFFSQTLTNLRTPFATTLELSDTRVLTVLHYTLLHTHHNTPYHYNTPIHRHTAPLQHYTTHQRVRGGWQQHRAHDIVVWLLNASPQFLLVLVSRSPGYYTGRRLLGSSSGGNKVYILQIIPDKYNKELI